MADITPTGTNTVKSRLIRIAALCAALIAPSLALAKTPAASPAAVLIRQAQAALAANKSTDALNIFESAAAVDPNNAAPYLGMAKAYEQLGLRGKALRYYREALTINPNDVDALEAQAIGMIARGKPEQARVDLDRLHKICLKGCTATARVEAALSKAGTQSSMIGKLQPRRDLPKPVAKP